MFSERHKSFPLIFLASDTTEPYRSLMHYSNPLTVPTPSPSLNRALATFCRATNTADLSDTEFYQTAESVVRTHRPVTTVGRALTASDLISWLDDLTADEYFALAGVEFRALRTIAD
jgi:hypothetical protein